MNEIAAASETITIERTPGAVAFDALLRARGLSPRSAASGLTDYGRALNRGLAGEKPYKVAHPMVIDWRRGTKRPGPRYRTLIRLWAQTFDPTTGALATDPMPEHLWLTTSERGSVDPTDASPSCVPAA